MLNVQEKQLLLQLIGACKIARTTLYGLNATVSRNVWNAIFPAGNALDLALEQFNSYDEENKNLSLLMGEQERCNPKHSRSKIL